uniref:uroporphyrinogen-III C-methyltransferase n=1 Tax=Paulinella chromatophora TaxID=39717 RepID=B1X4G0_PAUCH|nr:uroporphyrin-III C-methyltransferase [Paulinella chromatophora]ACB42829.1 uroporphyrin-III C-methyltransferase [Paulinella chromatophora]
MNTIIAGTVYLVGAGPGDPELLTIKAHRLLLQCDAIVYDALIPQQLLDLTSLQCERHFVGKRRGFHSVPQSNINTILLELAYRHRCVVRLKGGDPFVFGRGGEEAAYLNQHGIKVQIVPGITSGIAAPAYVGIPITHRCAGSSVTFVTGHEEINELHSGVNWRALAVGTDSLVIYMGLHNLRCIIEELMAGGLDFSTPAAAIQQGTVGKQRHLITVLGKLADLTEIEKLIAPSIIVIGNIVAQRVAACAPMPANVEMPITHNQ